MRTFKAAAIWTSERQVIIAPSGMMQHDQTPGPLLVAGIVFNMFLPEPLPHYYSRYMHYIALWAISMIFNGQWDSILIILTIGKIREGESYDFACSKVERDPLRCPNISEKGRVMSSQFRRIFLCQVWVVTTGIQVDGSEWMIPVKHMWFVHLFSVKTLWYVTQSQFSVYANCSCRNLTPVLQWSECKLL